MIDLQGAFPPPLDRQSRPIHPSPQGGTLAARCFAILASLRTGIDRSGSGPRVASRGPAPDSSPLTWDSFSRTHPVLSLSARRVARPRLLGLSQTTQPRSWTASGHRGLQDGEPAAIEIELAHRPERHRLVAAAVADRRAG